MDDPRVLTPELARLVRDAALNQKASLQPRPKRGRRSDIPGTPSSENYRLIRGQSYGIQSGGTILLRNIVVLAGGLDPTNGNPAQFVRVVNIFNGIYADNEWVDAVYSPLLRAFDAADWETLKTSSSEKNRVLRGLVYATVAAGTAPFQINNIKVLSGGLDPRTTPGDATELLVCTKTQKEVVRAGEPVSVIWNAVTPAWELLVVERYRAIRGTWYSGTSTLVVKAIVPLESGLDPRSDTTDATEPINVSNVPGDAYASGDSVTADYNAATGLWEARPKGVDKKVAAGTDDTAPATLIEKLFNTGSYNSSIDTLVTFQEIDDSGVKKIQAFVPTPAGGGGGTYTAGCGLLLVGAQFKLDYDQVAGPGLGVTAPSGGCPQLKVLVDIQVGKIYGGMSGATVSHGAGGGAATVLPGTGQVLIYQPTADPSRYDFFDTPEPAMNWFAAPLNSNEPVLIARTKEQEKFVIPFAVELINFIYHSATKGAIEGATSTAGPTILPTFIEVEQTEKNITTSKLEPTGNTLEVEYREGKRLDQLPTGKVYMGEALRIGSATPVILVIYCTEWSETGGG